MLTTIIVSAVVTLVGILLFSLINSKSVSSKVSKVSRSVNSNRENLLEKIRENKEVFSNEFTDTKAKINELEDKIDDTKEDLLSEMEKESVKELLKNNFKEYLIKSLIGEGKTASEEEPDKAESEVEEDLDEDDGFLTEDPVDFPLPTLPATEQIVKDK